MARRSPWTTGGRRDLVAIVAVALAVVAVTVLSTVLLPERAASPDLLAGRPWWEGWVNWDSGWYRQIALYGYSYTPGSQGPVAFFPLYPLLMRVGGSLVGSVTGPGVVITLASGVGAAVLLSRWFRERLSPDAAWTALLLFLLYPYSFYLFGPLYADALFLLAILGSFTALERGHPWLAGLIGAAATAARPLGVVLVVGLVVRTLERRGVFGDRFATDVDVDRRRTTPRSRPLPAGGGGSARLRLADCGVLVAALGPGRLRVLPVEAVRRPPGLPHHPVGVGAAGGARHLVQGRLLPGDGQVRQRERLHRPGRQRRGDGGGHRPPSPGGAAFRVGVRHVHGPRRRPLRALHQELHGHGPLPARRISLFAVAAELLEGRGRLRTLVLAGSGVGLAAAASFFARAYYLS